MQDWQFIGILFVYGALAIAVIHAQKVERDAAKERKRIWKAYEAGEYDPIRPETATDRISNITKRARERQREHGA